MIIKYLNWLLTSWKIFLKNLQILTLNINHKKKRMEANIININKIMIKTTMTLITLNLLYLNLLELKIKLKELKR